MKRASSIVLMLLFLLSAACTAGGQRPPQTQPAMDPSPARAVGESADAAASNPIEPQADALSGPIPFDPEVHLART